MVRQELLEKQKRREARKKARQRAARQALKQANAKQAETQTKVRIIETVKSPKIEGHENSLVPKDWYGGKRYTALKGWQVNIAKRRQTDREERRNNAIEKKKKEIVEKYGTEPTICYFYYLWNAVDYAGEKTVRESFKTIAGQGDEIIVADYCSTDGTPELAKEYGLKVINVEKTPNVIFHMSKLVNAVLAETKCNFVVDLSIHTAYPKNFDAFFRNWVQNNDITKKLCAGRGLMVKEAGVVRRHSTAVCFYRPFLTEAGGYDEKTSYGSGTTPYILDLMLSVYRLEWDDHPLDFLHKPHNHFKMPLLRGLHGFGEDIGKAHGNSLHFAEGLIDKLYYNFDEGAKKVQNSYQNPKVFGIGLSRSGTASLAHALEVLGYKTIHAPRPFFGPGLIDTLKKWDAADDSQVGFAYKELDKAFPHSKFILTTRELESWLKSYETYLGFQKTRFQPFDPKWWEEFQLKFYGDVSFNKETYTKVYLKHHKEVMEYFLTNENFIVLNLERGEGWEKLCKFLDKPIPKSPFPHINKSTKIKKEIYKRKHTPKVFGIGLSRTGTTSLTDALTKIGYDIIHDNIRTFKPDFEDIVKEIDESDGAVDNPIALLYKKLDKEFPGSKFILTIRTLKSWLESIEFFLNLESEELEGIWKDIRELLYGDNHFNKKSYRKAFIKHHWEVMDYFKDKDNLLILDMSKGDCWKKLCKFLFGEFPHSFTTKDIKDGWKKSGYVNKIFGIGLSKTGCTSLRHAFDRFAYKTGQYPQPPMLPELLDVVKNYQFLNDVPIAHAFKELDKAFPGSKFILNTRELDSWLESARNHKEFQDVVPERYHPDAQKLREAFYGCPKFDEKMWLITYYRHHKEVYEYFKDRPQDLLVMDLVKGDGYEKLCTFLNRKIVEIPFPHSMKRSELPE